MLPKKSEEKENENISHNENFELQKTSSLIIHQTYENIVFSKLKNSTLLLNYIFEIVKEMNTVLKQRKYLTDELIESKKFSLADPQKEKSLFLDLDETLIHVSQNGKHQVIIGKDIEVCFHVRPYALEFLKNMYEYFEIYIFTASSKEYASKITSYLDPDALFIEGILSRDCCLELPTKGKYIKDLRLIKNRNLKNILLVDNLSSSFGTTIENGIPILEFIDDQNDKQLYYLQNYLIELSKQEDVRAMNDNRFTLRSLHNEYSDLL